jgi:multiple antibiotic resistance protein
MLKKDPEFPLGTAINVFIILIIFFFRVVLSFFSNRIEALRIAGGIVIATSGFFPLPNR